MMNKATNLYRRAKGKVVDTTAKIISGPSVMRSQIKEAKENSKADTLKYARETRHVDLTGQDYRNPIFRARASAAIIKSDVERKAQGRKPLFE